MTLRSRGHLDRSNVPPLCSRAKRITVVCQDILSDPQVAAAHDSMNFKALLIWLEAPADRYVLSLDDSPAGLRKIEDGIVLIDAVLRRKITGVGCCPMLIRCHSYFLIFHTTRLISVPVASDDQIPSRITPRSNITSALANWAHLAFSSAALRTCATL